MIARGDHPLPPGREPQGRLARGRSAGTGAARRRRAGAEVQPLEDLPDRRPRLDPPAVERAHQLGLCLGDHEMPRHLLPARRVAVAIGCSPGQPAAGACLVQFAAPEALGQDRPLVLGDGTLALQQELVVGVVGDRMVQEHHLAAGTAELLQEQHLAGAAPGRRTCGPARRSGLSTARMSTSASSTASRKASSPGRSRREPLDPSSRKTCSSARS
jgi:hypothetical protein